MNKNYKHSLIFKDKSWNTYIFVGFSAMSNPKIMRYMSFEGNMYDNDWELGIDGTGYFSFPSVEYRQFGIFHFYIVTN